MLPPSCTRIQNSETENLTSPEAMLTAHTSFWSKLEQTEYEKCLSLWGCKHIQGFCSQDCWRYVHSTVCVCLRACTYTCVQKLREFWRKDKDKDRDRTWREKKNTKGTEQRESRKKGNRKWNGSGDVLDEETWVRTSEWGMALCLEERSSCSSKRRKTKEEGRERERERRRKAAFTTHQGEW